jgi:hypothetical protein
LRDGFLLGPHPRLQFRDPVVDLVPDLRANGSDPNAVPPVQRGWRNAEPGGRLGLVQVFALQEEKWFGRRGDLIRFVLL